MADKSTPSQNEENRPPVSEEQSKLNAVRDLLFGQNVQEYRSEFDELKKIIKDNQGDTDARLEDMNQKIMDRLDEVEKNFDQQLAELAKNLSDEVDKLTHDKMDRNSLATLLHQLAEKIED